MSAQAVSSGGGGIEPLATVLAAANERLRRLRRHGQVTGGFALACLELDQNDVVEAGLGPVWMEALLAGVGRRISLSEGMGMVASLGGGRFVGILPDAGHPASALRLATALRERIEAYSIAGHELYPTLSAGVAVADAGCFRAEDLLRDARAALREATSAGGGCRLFEPRMRQSALEALGLDAALRRAIRDREFELHYQPIVGLERGEIQGFEALLRWRRPGQGVLAPGAFLAAAEDSGLIVDIGRWALREACEQLRHWRDLPGCEGLTVNVNLSTLQLRQPTVIADVEDALATAGLPGNALHLELTESALMESGAAAVETLCRLKALGVSLCIDDFGVGYSSLAYLHRFPVDVLKIDRSFVSRLGADGESQGIISAIVALAHGLGLLVVPEGVETADQLGMLRSLECTLAQGYHFARPLPPGEAEALLVAGPRW